MSDKQDHVDNIIYLYGSSRDLSEDEGLTPLRIVFIRVLADGFIVTIPLNHYDPPIANEEKWMQYEWAGEFSDWPANDPRKHKLSKNIDDFARSMFIAGTIWGRSMPRQGNIHPGRLESTMSKLFNENYKPWIFVPAQTSVEIFPEFSLRVFYAGTIYGRRLQPE
ncbi:MAG: hypothetical protein CMI52_02580 [Parcubacteria group bacterium]|nr:hypothetical protein [Parcubacteria group bacterium]|tara:strand:- start:1 stop:495 length:495 start_codon:yes stop_codon:yes gene_type:complete